MAQDMFININGIEGESLDFSHKGEIEVLRWNWSVAQPANMHSGSGGGAGKSTVHDLYFKHYIDRSSTNLIQYCLTGKHIPEAGQSNFNSYSNKSANGAHFLIDKDGKVYQTASLFKMTWHVGLMQSKCFLQKVCQPTETRLLALHTKTYWKREVSQEISNIERGKNFPERFPNNTDSIGIGIEIVGMAVQVKGKSEPVYETVNDKKMSPLNG